MNLLQRLEATVSDLFQKRIEKESSLKVLIRKILSRFEFQTLRSLSIMFEKFFEIVSVSVSVSVDNFPQALVIISDIDYLLGKLVSDNYSYICQLYATRLRLLMATAKRCHIAYSS